MAQKQPSNTDRLVGHALVAIVLALIGTKLKGTSGAVAGAVIGVVAHEMLDAPVAGFIAEVT